MYIIFYRTYKLRFSALVGFIQVFALASVSVVPSLVLNLFEVVPALVATLLRCG